MAELSRGQILKNPEILGAGNDGAKIRFLDADENSHVDIKVPDTVGTAYTFTLPDSSGTNNFYLKTDGSGNTSWAAVSASPGGNTGEIQYNNAGSFAGASSVTTDGTNLTLRSQSEIRFNDSDNSNYVGFAASSVVSANRSYTLPDTVGSAGQVLKIASSPAPTSTSASLIWDNDNAGGAGASPGGVDTYIQFNDGGTFGGDAGFTYNKTTDSATLSGSLTVGVGLSAGATAVNLSNGFYSIGGVSVLTSTTLGSGVVNSSLTSVGTLTNLNVGDLSVSTNTVTSTGDIILDPVSTNPVRIAGGSPLRLFGSTTTNNYVGVAVSASIITDYTITLPGGPPTAANEVLQFATNGTAEFVSNVKTLNFIIDGGGSVITTGVKGNVVLDADYTFNGWTVVSDLSGAIVVDVRRSTFGSFPTTNVDAGTSIVTGALPTITASGRSAENLSITPVDLAARDILEFEVNSATTITRVTVALRLISR